VQFAYFVIQSGEYPADELEARARVFIGQLPAQLKALGAEDWQTIVAGVRSGLEEKDKSIAERASRLFTLAYDRQADWGRRRATLAALDALTQQRAADILASALAPQTAQVRTFLGFGRDHRPAAAPAVSFGDAQAWKTKRRYE